MTTAQENLVAWYRMDDSSASTIVLDSSGNGYNGTSVRNTNLMHVTGKIDSALSFDGLTDNITLTSTPMYNSLHLGEISINCWFTNITSAGGMFGFSNGSSSFMCTYDEDIEITWEFPSFDTVFDTTNWNNNSHSPQWFMFTLTAKQINPTTITANYYVNSIKDAQSGNITGNLISLISSTEYLGKDSLNNWNGKLDDIHIYNKALSVDEVKQLYNEGNLNQNQLNSTGEQLLSMTGV